MENVVNPYRNDQEEAMDISKIILSKKDIAYISTWKKNRVTSCGLRTYDMHTYIMEDKIGFPFFEVRLRLRPSLLCQIEPRFIYLLGLFLSTLHQPSKLKKPLESELIQPKKEAI